MKNTASHNKQDSTSYIKNSVWELRVLSSSNQGVAIPNRFCNKPTVNLTVYCCENLLEESQNKAIDIGFSVTTVEEWKLEPTEDGTYAAAWKQECREQLLIAKGKESLSGTLSSSWHVNHMEPRSQIGSLQVTVASRFHQFLLPLAESSLSSNPLLIRPLTVHTLPLTVLGFFLDLQHQQRRKVKLLLTGQCGQRDGRGLPQVAAAALGTQSGCSHQEHLYQLAPSTVFSQALQ